MDKLEKRHSGLDLSFVHGVMSGRIDSSLPLSPFHFRASARQTRRANMMYVPTGRIGAFAFSLFGRLPRI